jgi:hypothetical protein
MLRCSSAGNEKKKHFCGSVPTVDRKSIPQEFSFSTVWQFAAIHKRQKYSI